MMTEPNQGMRRHKLLTKKIERRLPPLYSQDDVNDPMIQLKMFCPYGPGTWYFTEYDPETRTFYGYADLGYGYEAGYSSLDEMAEAMVTLWGTPVPAIERDCWFTPCHLSKVVPELVRDEVMDSIAAPTKTPDIIYLPDRSSA